MLRAFVLLAVWATLAVPIALITLPWTVLSRNASLLYRWSVAIGRIGLLASGVRIRVRYEAPLPSGACLFLCNHASNLDPPLLAAVLAPRRVAMLVKQELLRMPLLGWAMQLAGFVPVARSGSVEDAKRSLEQAAQVLHSGIDLAIFVEGTRSPDGRLLPFKKGPFFLAMECGAPVVPVTLIGTHARLPKGRRRLQRGVVEVVIHQPLDPAAYGNKELLRTATRKAIASVLPQEQLAKAELTAG